MSTFAIHKQLFSSIMSSTGKEKDIACSRTAFWYHGELQPFLTMNSLHYYLYAAEDPCWWTQGEMAAIHGTRLGYLAAQYQATLPMLIALRDRLLDICR